MSLHGLSKSAWRRFEAGASWYYEILEPGFKYNMTDVAAAIGLAQLERADELCRRRQAVARHYTERLSAWADFVQTPVELPDRRSSWHIYPVQLRLEELDIDRNAFLAELGQRGVTCSVHWMPLHLHPYYERTYGYRPEDFPHASAAWPRLISLPLFPDLTESEVEYVCDAMAALFRQHAATGRLVAAGG
jgi:perosamine synthetase